MPLVVKGAFTLFNINKSLSAALSVLDALNANIDLSLFSSVGLAALKQDAQLQLQAALSAEASLTTAFVNPIEGFTRTLASLKQLAAQLTAAIAAPSPPIVTVEMGAALSAAKAQSAQLSTRLATLTSLVNGAIAAKAPSTRLSASLTESLSAGPAFTAVFTGDSLATSGAAIASRFASGLVDGSDSIAPASPCFGIVIVTKDPAVWGKIQAILDA